MAKINTHGLKMIGLRNACAETRKIHNTGLVLEISYDLNAGKIITKEYADWNSYTVFDSESIQTVMRTSISPTQQEIADAVDLKINAERIW